MDPGSYFSSGDQFGMFFSCRVCRTGKNFPCFREKSRYRHQCAGGNSSGSRYYSDTAGLSRGKRLLFSGVQSGRGLPDIGSRLFHASAHFSGQEPVGTDSDLCTFCRSTPVQGSMHYSEWQIFIIPPHTTVRPEEHRDLFRARPRGEMQTSAGGPLARCVWYVPLQTDLT